jgi:hypothetical protein
MLRILKIAAVGAVFSLAALGAWTQTGPMLSAPVPGQILNAKKVFISNMGVDGFSLAAFKKENEVDKPYNQFYVAMKSWARYELVDNPTDADLVLEIRFAAPIASASEPLAYAPQIGLSIVDAKSHFTLWNFVEPVAGAFRRATWDKNFNEGMTNLIDDLKRLTTPTTTTPQATNKE